MHILVLSQILPYPPNAGPRVKLWNVLLHMREQGHRVTLATYVRKEEEPHLATVRGACERVLAVPMQRSRLADIMAWSRSHLTARPFLVERDDIAAMREAVGGILQKNRFDILHADQLTMTQFIRPGTSPAASAMRVFDAHNATWVILRRSRERVNPALRLALDLEASRLRRYEGNIVRSFDLTLAVTEGDREFLMQAANDGLDGRHPPRVQVIPIAVDTEALRPLERHPEPGSILALGSLHYAPNADGVLWFLEEVLSLVRMIVPEVHLTILGKSPPKRLQRLAESMPDTVRLAGFVPDLVPYLSRASVMVVPVLAGSGMRVRILEGLARGLPMVTTTIGLEGIEAQPGADVMVADTPGEFARSVASLLRDADQQNRLARAGRRLVEDRYDRRKVLTRLDQAYFETMKDMRPGST